jgi:4-amino-4-deoxy-L-arabinose transferase-like glycosyltransferase
MGMGMPDTFKLGRMERFLFWLLMAFGLASRLFGAWCFRHLADPDAAVAGLMSRHMAEGLGWPVFFYGQAYMGSLEPAVGALFCRLLGASGLAVCLGTALVGLLILPVVYAWARELGGARAGLAALALVVVGPAGYYPYLCQPRGGYAVIILTSALTLWLAGRLAADERENRPPAWPWYLALGLAAGIGWWTSGLTVAALTAAALLFLVFTPRTLLTGRVAAGLLGFAFGSAPFWIWNARHGNAAVAYLLQGVGPSAPWLHLKLFVMERLQALFGLTGAPVWWQAVVLAVLALVLVSAVAMGVAAARRRQNRTVVHLAGIFLFAVIWLVLFCRSSFAGLATPRYLTPLVPALAVLTGLVVVWNRRWVFAVPALAVLALLLAAQMPALSAARRKEALDGKMVAQTQREDDAIVRIRPEEDTFYMGFPYYWRNFSTTRNFCFTPFAHERYQPFFERAEYRDTAATRGNFGGIREFLAVSGGSADFPGPIVCGFEPPPQDVEEVPRDAFASIACSTRGDLGEIMFDGHLDTFWRRPAQNVGPQEDALEVMFRAPVPAAGLRLVSRTLVFPSRIQVEAWLPGAVDPVVLIPENRVPGLFWSGPRPYWQGRFYRVECRWPPVLVERLRLRLGADRAIIWKLSELQVFRRVPGPARPPERDTLPNLLRVLDERGVDRLYADRWAANAVHRETAGRVWTERELGPDDLLAGADPDPYRRNRLRFTCHTALLTLARDAPLCRRSLAARGVAMRETWLDPWVLFDFSPAGWQPEYADDQGLYWAGFACLKTDDLSAALALLARARSLRSIRGAEPEAIRLLARVVGYVPELRPALNDLAELLQQTGRTEEAACVAARAAQAWTPAVPAPIVFPGGMEFLGLTLAATNASPGRSLAMRYYWKHPPSRAASDGLSVFVHFTDAAGDLAFQDDHALLPGANVERQPEPLVFVEEREALVPAGLKPGDYTIWLGLFRDNGRRVAGRTDLPSERRAVRLPVTLRIHENGWE